MKIKHTWVKVVIFLLGLALICVGAYFSLPRLLQVFKFLVGLFMPFILGYLFFVLVNPLVNWLQKRLKFPRGISAVIVMIFVVGIIGGIITFIIWKLIDEIRNLSTQLPYIMDSMQSGFNAASTKLHAVYDVLPQNIQSAISGMGDAVSEKLAGFINRQSSPMVGYASNVAKALPSVFVGTIVFFLSSYFMITNSQAVNERMEKILSEKMRNRIDILKHEIKKYLGGYLKAQGIIMCIASVILFIGLTVINVQYAFVIAVCIAFMDALPFFGSGLALLPWSVVSFINGNIKLGVGLLVLYGAVALMRHLVEPKLVSSKIGMNPLLTLASMYVGYRLFSIGGMILGPVIMMLIISLYKAGIFDRAIHGVKWLLHFIKDQAVIFKNFVKDLFV